MKNLIIAALCLLSISTKAQVQTITVSNTSACSVSFSLRGNVSGGGCIGNYKSRIVTLAPSQSGIYNAGNFILPLNCPSCTPATLANGDDIIYAQIYDGDPAWGCTVAGVNIVGEACYTSNTSFSYTPNDNTCSACGTVNVTWTSGAGTATLTFF